LNFSVITVSLLFQSLFLHKKVHNALLCSFWQLVNWAMQWLDKLTQRIISKFIHKWLPLETWYHVHSMSTLQHCPSCHQQAETVDHFLWCNHPEWQQLWEELINQIQWLSIQKQLHQTIQDHIIQGIQSATTEITTLPTNTNHNSTHCSKQQQIGWKQIIYGRYLQQWIEAIDQQEPPINGHQLITKVIYLTWQQVATQWKVRNLHLHPATAQEADCSQLQATVLQILHEAQQHPHLADMIGHIDVDNLMAQPTKYIQQFITHNHNHIRDHNQAEAKRAQLHTHDIRTYFQRHIQQPLATATAKNLLWPP